MVKLSVNVNKIATLRNSRGAAEPSVAHAVEICLDAGAPGITVHPRADQRHIRPDDVVEIAGVIARYNGGPRGPIEFNIEGDPRADLLDLVVRVRPDQCTLVPVMPGEVTSHTGWRPEMAESGLSSLIARLHEADVRVSVFVDPEEAPIWWAKSVGADRIELYTEPFARAYAQGEAAAQASFAAYCTAAELAHQLGLGINAGHDLDTANLRLFRQLPHLAEVSIGHALVSRALWVGLERAVREYLHVLRAIE